MTPPTPLVAARCPVDHAALARQHDPNGCPVSPRAAAFNPFESAYMQAPGEYLRWAREQEPVFWSPQLGYWIVTRYEDVKAVFRDNILFSPSVALEKITPASPEVLQILQGYGFAMNRTMVNEDEPDHMARRRLLSGDEGEGWAIAPPGREEELDSLRRKLAAAVGAPKYRNRIPNSGPRKPSSHAPRVATTGSQTIFIKLALSAILPLLRNAASDSVPPMQINASGNVVCARY